MNVIKGNILILLLFELAIPIVSYNSSQLITFRRMNDVKPVVRIVAYDKIIGHMNWLQKWFVSYAENNCTTSICTITDTRADVRQSSGIFIF